MEKSKVTDCRLLAPDRQRRVPQNKHASPFNKLTFGVFAQAEFCPEIWLT